MPQSRQCIGCKHYLGDFECEAFPEGIPKEILAGLHDHRQPFPGDDGIRWEKLELTPTVDED